MDMEPMLWIRTRLLSSQAQDPTQQFMHSTSQPAAVHPPNLPFFRHRKPLFAFGFGGMIATATHNGNNNVIDIREVRNAYSTAPLVKEINSFNFQTPWDPNVVDGFLQDRINSIDSSDSSLLWATIRTRYVYKNQINPPMFSQNSKMQGTPEQQLIVRLSNTSSASVPTQYNSPAVDPRLVDQLQLIIVQRGEDEALKFAIQNKLWPFALIIANSLNKEALEMTTNEFLSTTLAPCPLQNIMRAISGQRENVTLATWPEHLSTLLQHYTSATPASLLDMAKFLEENNETVPAHVCRLLASEELHAKPSNFTLVGTTWDYPTVSSIIMTQLSSASSQNLLPYTIFYTMALIDYGFVERAKDNNDKLISIFEKAKLTAFKKVAVMIGKNIDYLTSKRNTKIVTKVTSKLNSFITSFVNGEEASQATEIVKLPNSISIDSIATNISGAYQPAIMQINNPPENVTKSSPSLQNTFKAPPPVSTFAKPPQVQSVNTFKPPPSVTPVFNHQQDATNNAPSFKAPPAVTPVFNHQQEATPNVPAFKAPPPVTPVFNHQQDATNNVSQTKPEESEDNQNTEINAPGANYSAAAPQANKFTPPPPINKFAPPPSIPIVGGMKKSNSFAPPPPMPMIHEQPSFNARRQPQQPTKRKIPVSKTMQSMGNIFVPPKTHSNEPLPFETPQEQAPAPITANQQPTVQPEAPSPVSTFKPFVPSAPAQEPEQN